MSMLLVSAFFNLFPRASICYGHVIGYMYDKLGTIIPYHSPPYPTSDMIGVESRLSPLDPTSCQKGSCCFVAHE